MKKIFTTVKAQLVLVTVGFSLFCTILSACVCFAFVQRYARQNLIQAANFNLQLISGLCEKDVMLINSLARWCSANQQIAQWFETPDNMILRVKAWDRLKEEFQNNNANQFIRRLIICNKDLTAFIQVGSKTVDSRPITQESLKNFSKIDLTPEHNWKKIISDPFAFEKNCCVLPVILPLYDIKNLQTTGSVYIFIDTNFITDRFQNYSLSKYEYPELKIGASQFAIKPDYLSSVLNHLEMKDKKFTVEVSIKNTGITFTQNLKEALVRQNNFLFAKITISIAVGTAFLATLLKLWLTKMISFPLSKINAQLKKVASGNFDPNREIEWNNEIGDVGKGINSLSINVKSLMEHKINDEKNKRLLEYKMLQNQINPHFLYNTLNAIKWMATIQRSQGIAEMITALARLLKNVSKASNLIPLSYELELLDDYFVILQYRYGGAIYMTKEIPDEVMQNLIPSFTLQPLLENAIFHGIEPTGQAGKISLTGTIEKPESTGTADSSETPSANSCKDGKIKLVLTDNGRGMDEETIRKIFTESESSDGMFKQVGLLNVHKRIQYEFGSSYGLSILSEPGKYTSITIELPLIKA